MIIRHTIENDLKVKSINIKRKNQKNAVQMASESLSHVTPGAVTRQAPLSMESTSKPRDWTHFSHAASGFFTIWATREV